MAKSVLKIQYEYPFEVIGIISTVKDYRLCHSLNTSLQMNFKREHDLSIVMNRQGDDAFFSLFTDNTSDGEKHLLIVNKGSNSWFFSEIKNVDYLYIVKDPGRWFVLDDMISRLRQIEVIGGAYPIPLQSIKSKENLLFLN